MEKKDSKVDKLMVGYSQMLCHCEGVGNVALVLAMVSSVKSWERLMVMYTSNRIMTFLFAAVLQAH